MLHVSSWSIVITFMFRSTRLHPDESLLFFINIYKFYSWFRLRFFSLHLFLLKPWMKNTCAEFQSELTFIRSRSLVLSELGWIHITWTTRVCVCDWINHLQIYLKTLVLIQSLQMDQWTKRTTLWVICWKIESKWWKINCPIFHRICFLLVTLFP